MQQGVDGLVSPAVEGFRAPSLPAVSAVAAVRLRPRVGKAEPEALVLFADIPTDSSVPDSLIGFSDCRCAGVDWATHACAGLEALAVPFLFSDYLIPLLLAAPPASYRALLGPVPGVVSLRSRELGASY